MKYWIGKIKGDIHGKGSRWKLHTNTISKDKSWCENRTGYLAGFAEWKVVRVEVKEVKQTKKGRK